jgi:hypothetical protein
MIAARKSMPLVALILSLGSLLGSKAYSLAQEKLPPGAVLQRIEAQPAKIEIASPFRYAQLLLTGVLQSGERMDVTRMVQFDKPGNVVISASGRVRPTADGNGEIRASLLGQSVSIPVQISNQKDVDKQPVSFVRDVMPVLTRLGCNQGTCHGAQDGKNGFKLSLRGYDPQFDHLALTDDLEGRRFNRAAPDYSLMLLKPVGAVPHVGGVLLQPGEPYYQMLRNWIAGGVKLDLDSPRVQSIEIVPRSAVIALPGMRQQFAVFVKYSDGGVRDVTAEAFVESSNTEVATADRQATVTAVRRGEATMLARYEGAYAAATLIVMGDRSGFAWKETPEFNFIDTLVYEKLRQIKVLPSDVCSDGEFLRRVSLDLTGLPPLPEQVRAFLADSRPTRVKRDELVDRLVGSPEYIEHWTNKWADLLQVNRKFLGPQGAAAFREYIRKAIAENRPYDQFVREILTGAGSNIDNPPASYYKILRDPGSAMENTTQLFLAIRFNCNKCHDHPFERWTQDQYYQLSAYFARVGRSEDPRYAGQKVGGSAVEGATPLVEVIADLPSGEITHQRTGVQTPPAFPYNHSDLAPPTASRREQLARWITSKENPYFARSYVNRLWAYLLGVGLIEPIDDIRAGNPPSNPALLDRLTQEFITSGFNIQHMLKLICKSRTYQHSVVANAWNQDDETNYSRALARRLPAEVLYDAIQRATGSTSQLPGLPAGARAAQLLDSAQDAPGGFLDLFGKPPRESACECERSDSMLLGPVLTLVNGPVVGEAVRDPNNRIARLLAAEKDDGKVVEELYLAVLSRLPTDKERAAAVQALKDGMSDYETLRAEAQKHQDALASYLQGIDARFAAWEANLRKQTAWTPLEVVSATSAVGATLTLKPDGSILASGKNDGPETYKVKARSKLTGITGLRLELLTDASLPKKGPGRSPANGNLVLNELTVAVTADGSNDMPQPAPLQNAQATFSQDGYAVGSAIDGNLTTGWALSPQLGKDHSAVFTFKTPISYPNGALFEFSLLQQYQDKQHNIGKFRLSVTTSPTISLSGPPEPLARLLQIDPAKRTAAETQQLRGHFEAQDAELARLRSAVAEHPLPTDPRQPGAQDIVWALLNSKAFQFNH